MSNLSNNLSEGIKEFLGINEDTTKEIKDWLSKHDNFRNRLILSFLVISASFILLTKIPNISFGDFVLNFSTEILGTVITIFLIEWFLNEREKKKKLIIRFILEKDFESIKYSLDDYLHAVLPQILLAEDEDLRDKAKDFLLSLKPNKRSYANIQETVESLWMPFLVEYLSKNDRRLDKESLKNLSDAATKLLSLCERKMNLYGAIYLEDTFLRLFSILQSAKSLLATIRSYETQTVSLEETRHLLFDAIPDEEFKKIKHESTKELHDSICNALADSLIDLVKLWNYMEKIQAEEGKVDEKLIEFWRQTSVFK